MREHYDQFVQQEVFASGFGKGDTAFGWTFGPTPGSRVLNPGTRTTYTALAVPANATGLTMKMEGCAFHHNTSPPKAYPPEGKDDGIECGTENEVTIGLPDRDSSGSFWVNQIRYSQVKPGQRATVVLQGSFSPETTVLANGKRLTQVVGLGKPETAMDTNGLESPGTGVINGSYEFVNNHYLTLALNVPDGFANAKFPLLTLISPSRSATINSIPLVINGEYGQKLEDQKLLPETPPPMNIATVDFLGSAPDIALAGVTGAPMPIVRMTGARLSAVDRLWINGVPIGREHMTPLSDGALLVKFDDPATLRWNFTAVTGEAQISARTHSTISMANPLRLMITSTSIQSTAFDPKKKTKTVTVVVNGNRFTPELLLTIVTANPAVTSTQLFGGDTQFTAIVTAPIDFTDSINLELSLPNTPVRVASPFVLPNQSADPPKAADSAATTKTTEIDTKKTITTKDGVAK